MASDSSNPSEVRLENGLPPVRRIITTHDPSTKKAVIHSTEQSTFKPMRNGTVGYNVVYTTSQSPVTLNDDADIKAHEQVMASGKLGLVSPRGTVCRIVDFGPNNSNSNPMMHRTRSLDYGVVLEGTIEFELDSGEKVTMGRGDVAVQRATMHAWRNPSETRWARMLFVLMDCEPVRIGGEVLGEDLGAHRNSMPASGN